MFQNLDQKKNSICTRLPKWMNCWRLHDMHYTWYCFLLLIFFFRRYQFIQQHLKLFSYTYKYWSFPRLANVASVILVIVLFCSNLQTKQRYFKIKKKTPQYTDKYFVAAAYSYFFLLLPRSCYKCHIELMPSWERCDARERLVHTDFQVFNY